MSEQRNIFTYLVVGWARYKPKTVYDGNTSKTMRQDFSILVDVENERISEDEFMDTLVNRSYGYLEGKFKGTHYDELYISNIVNLTETTPKGE